MIRQPLIVQMSALPIELPVLRSVLVCVHVCFCVSCDELSSVGMVTSVWPPGSHENSSSETEFGGVATDEMPPQRLVYGWI